MYKRKTLLGYKWWQYEKIAVVATKICLDNLIYAHLKWQVNSTQLAILKGYFTQK